MEAKFAVVCSYLGISARDLAEIGKFSDRFARDLLAGRKPFPESVQSELQELHRYTSMIHEAMYQDVVAGDPTIYIYRTIQQLRHSPVARVWPKPYLGPYRVAAYQVMERCIREGHKVHLVFAETPKVLGD